jgi:acyl carrier protein
MVDSKNKLIESFTVALGINADQVTDALAYRSIPEWDSVGHMALVAEIETRFDVMLDTDDIVDLSSVAKAREILGKYQVSFDAA